MRVEFSFHAARLGEENTRDAQAAGRRLGANESNGKNRRQRMENLNMVNVSFVYRSYKFISHISANNERKKVSKTVIL